MNEFERNKQINQLKRQVVAAVERIKTLELDLEPQGRISEAFSVLEKHIDNKFAAIDARFDRLESRLDRLESSFDRLEHQLAQLQTKLEVIGKIKFSCRFK